MPTHTTPHRAAQFTRVKSPFITGLLAAAWALCGVGGVGAVSGCATTQPLDERTIVDDSFARTARSRVTLAAVGTPTETTSARGTSVGAVRPVTCILLPGGDLLTAAHTLPTTDLGAVRMYKDPVTGAYRVDEDKPTGEGAPIVVIVDGVASGARVTASDTLRYASAGVASRASVPADWAIISPDSSVGRRGRAVTRIGEARPGERCVMVGFPAALMDEDLFASSGGVQRIEDLRWIGAPGVVIEGTVRSITADRIEVATTGVLGARGRGLSGGGVFVERGGQPVLVGIAVQAAKASAVVIACPLPEAVTDRF